MKGERQADQGQSEQQMRKATEGKRFGRTKKYFLGVRRDSQTLNLKFTIRKNVVQILT